MSDQESTSRQPGRHHLGEVSIASELSLQTTRRASRPPSTRQPGRHHLGEVSIASELSLQTTRRASRPPSTRQPGRHHLGEVSIASELSLQTTRRASRPPSRGGTQHSARHIPYDRHDLDNTVTAALRSSRVVRGQRRGTVLETQPTPASLPYPTLFIHPQAIPTLYRIPQNPGPPQLLHYQNIRQMLNSNYTHSTPAQITPRSPSQLFTPNASLQLIPRSTPMVFIPYSSPPPLIPITAPQQSFTSAGPSNLFELPFPTDRPLDLTMPQRQLPTLIPISQALPVRVRQEEPRPSVRPTPRTHTVTSTSSTIVYIPPTVLTHFNTDESNQTEPRIDLHTSGSEHLVNQPSRYRPRTPVESLLEHQQCQLWPLDTFTATDLTEEMDTSEYDLWFGIQSADSTVVGALLPSAPVTRPPPTIVIVPPSPLTPSTTTTTTTTPRHTSSTEGPQFKGRNT